MQRRPCTLPVREHLRCGRFRHLWRLPRRRRILGRAESARDPRGAGEPGRGQPRIVRGPRPSGAYPVGPEEDLQPPARQL